MTTEDPSRADEMELELFLQRKGIVSRGLHAIDQPKSSDALEASIFAAIEAELNKEAQSLPQAANDPHGGSGVKPVRRRRFSPLWNIPLGLAAGVLLTVMVQKVRHADEFSASPVQSAQADKSKTTEVPQYQASAKISAPIAQVRPSEQPHIVIPPFALTMPRKRTTHPTVVDSNKVERIEIIGTNIKRADAETASAVQVITSQDLKQSGATTVSEYLRSSLRKEVTPCAPNSEWDDRPQALAWPITPTRTAEDPQQERACLDLIIEKLDDGANQEALEEWDKFRQTYPDYSAPDTITTRIRELQKAQK
jgi:hypothetical protein